MSSQFAVEAHGIVRDQRRFTLGPLDVLLPRGQVMGLVGPNGSGKTTLIKALLGVTVPDSGNITILGTTPTKAKSDVGAVLDADYLLPEWTVKGAAGPSPACTQLGNRIMPTT